MEPIQISKKSRKKLRQPWLFHFPELDPEDAKWVIEIRKIQIRQIEVNLAEIESMRPISYFTWLRVLSLANNYIKQIEGLSSMQQLEELHLSDNQIQEMSGLQSWYHLAKLNLSCNNIQKIEGLEDCTQLTHLWLNENRIEQIANLENNKKLQLLQLACNKIEIVSTALQAQEYLAELNLSGNWICSFKDVNAISALPSLVDLCFFDPDFDENPIWNLWNYQIYIICYCPNLQFLDKFTITEGAREFAEGTFYKKRVFYNMMIKVIHAYVDATSQYFKDIGKLLREKRLHEVEVLYRRRNEAELIDGDCSPMKQKIQQTFGSMVWDEQYLKQIIQLSEDVGKIQARHTIAELESGGNIRFKQGDGSEKWYNSVQNLIHRRFDFSQLGHYAGDGPINIQGIVRVRNKIQRNQFLEASEIAEDLEGRSVTCEYLFYGQSSTDWAELYKIAEQGFEKGQKRIAMTNSVGLSDFERVKLISLSKQLPGASIPPGAILVCKVILSKCLDDKTSPLFPSNCSIPEILTGYPVMWSVSNTLVRKNQEDMTQRIWLFDNQAQILPEYIVHFDYLTSTHAERVKQKYLRGIAKQWKKRVTARIVEETPSPPPRPLSLPKQQTTSILHMNLYNSSLEKVEFLEPLINLTYLNVSFNMLTELPGFDRNPKLQHIDAGYNSISNINIKQKLFLTQLDLHENELATFNNTIRVLAVFWPNIAHLTLFGNPIGPYSGLIHSLAHLQTIDYRQISTIDLQSDEKVEMTKSLIRPNASMSFSSQILATMRYYTQVGQIPEDIDKWEYQVEMLVLNYKSINQIQNLQQFKNLRKASFMYNQIGSMVGLLAWVNLEELSLEGNQISSLESIASFSLLTKLEVGRNRIKSLLPLSTCKYLQWLSVEWNQIDDSTGLKNLQNLLELYISSNNLWRTQDVLNFNSNSCLIILDIQENPITQKPNMRQFIIYSVQRLKVLNGVEISKSEQIEATNHFQGLLTDEILLKKLDKNTQSIKKLNLQNSHLKNLGENITNQRFPVLREMNLSWNDFQFLKGFTQLTLLQVLNISKNSISSLFMSKSEPIGLSAFPNLKALDVSYNQLQDLYGLQFAKLQYLRALLAGNNQIAKTEHLDSLNILKELDLSHNKIREIGKYTFWDLSSLIHLNLDNNLLSTLVTFNEQTSLTEISLQNNRIKEFYEVSKLKDLPQLTTVSLEGNPVAKKHLYRNQISKKLPTVSILDSQVIAAGDISLDAGQLPPLVKTNG